MTLDILPARQGYIVRDRYSRLYLSRDGRWSEKRGQAELFETDVTAQFAVDRANEAHRDLCERGL